MEDILYNKHLIAGMMCGYCRSCEGKVGYATEEIALKASISHNKWEKRKHAVEMYPCIYCEKWHVGGVMDEERLEQLNKYYDDLKDKLKRILK